MGSAVVGAGTSLVAANKNAKAIAAAKPKPLDIDKLITDARTAAADNYRTSFELEAQYNPEQAALRRQANAALSDRLAGDTPAMRARNSLLSDMGGAANPLLSESSDSILKSLKLGGNLSAETQNAMVRGALQRSGQAGLSGSAAARGLVARDLGLTSLALEQQRQQAGLMAGQALSADAINRLGALSGAAGQDVQSTGLLTGLIDARGLPVSGLDPGSIAGATIGELGAQNQYRADAASASIANRNSLINNLLGFGTTALVAGAAGGAFGGKSALSGLPAGSSIVGPGGAPAGSGLANTPIFIGCWVAREVFGDDNPEWTEFREWLLTKGDPNFVEFYKAHGPKIAEEIASQPEIKQLIRYLMQAAKS